MFDTFFISIRQSFDPCFRYMVFTRKSSAEAAQAFFDLMGLIEMSGAAVVDRSFHKDPFSDTVALVLKLRPDMPSAAISDLVGGKLPEDIFFAIYEANERAGKNRSEDTSRNNGGHHP
ncbi:MAG: hypothetical protein K9L59_16905 [Desulfobacterales bacterium]|nr:hypothetical protein [Desulfobacterales bacterium]